jgi:GNAT superfamily N-acetyltransferase
MLVVNTHRDAQAFLDRAEAWLLEAEAQNNTILATAYLLRKGKHSWREPVYLATIETGNDIRGCVTRPPPDGVHLTDVPVAALPIVVEQLAALYDAIPEAWGPEGTVHPFAQLWATEQKCAQQVRARHQYYTLSRVIHPARAIAGALRRGEPSDLEFLRQWAPAYARDVGAAVDVGAFFVNMLNRGCLYVWDDHGPCSVVTLSSFTKNGARITAVYTPPEHRNRGCASAGVAALSQMALDEGRRMCLILADAGNPTSNGIYRRIGYEPINEAVQIQFS